MAIGALAGVIPVFANPTLPSGIPTTVFNVTSYGAVGNGVANNTTAIQDAINAAEAAGGGIVEIPAASKPYLSNALTIDKDKIELDVVKERNSRRLSGPIRPLRSCPRTIENNNNVLVTGGGIIDGNGAGWWTGGSGGGPASSRPHLIKVSGATIVEFNNITVSNAPEEHIAFSNTSEVTCNEVTVSSPSTSPNTDGIDPAGSNYLIENCNIADGDDNIAIKPQSVACNTITITGCTLRRRPRPLGRRGDE